MNTLTELKQAVLAYLEGKAGFQDIALTGEYLLTNRDYPLKKAALAVGFDGVEASPGGLGGYLGTEAGRERLLGAEALITLRFDIYHPPKAAGTGCHTLFEALCDSLFLHPNPFGLTKMWCGDIVFDNAAGANRLTARAQLRAALTLEGERLPITQFQVKRSEDFADYR